MQKNIPYQVGTIKLTWIDPKNYKVLSSSMYPSLEEALRAAEAHNGNFLIFKLKQTDGTSYSWDLLDYGRSKEYVRGMKFKDNFLLKYGSMALMVFGAYSLFKLITKK
jgi:hypothetical protein